MSPDHYAGAAQGWAEGATLVYGPIAQQLVATSPHRLAGRVVLDLGAGTGVASRALAALGARPLATDLSLGMLEWDAGGRPPAVAADVRALPFWRHAVDDCVAAFVFNHLADPVAGMAEAVRITRPGGALLACVFANAFHSEVRDAVDEAAGHEGWQVPGWYIEIKEQTIPILGTSQDMATTARAAGLFNVVVDERAVDVGVTQPEQLVQYRLGQAHFSTWLEQMSPERAVAVKTRIADAVRPIMRPYRPVVVFLSGVVPRN